MASHPSDFLRPSGEGREPSLLDILDHVLNAGIVVQGSVVISIAGVDLVYVGLSAVLTSVETALRTLPDRKGAALPGARKRRT
jgi:hypothetical protein